MLTKRPAPALIIGRAAKRWQTTILSYFVFAFGLVWTAGTFAYTYGGYIANLTALRNRSYQVVEGRVTNFSPLPVSGHGVESFDVDGVSFSYSDYIITSGFNHTAANGGPIRPGLYVRVTYVDDAILRLEIAK
jgi:hypothetical protein